MKIEVPENYVITPHEHYSYDNIEHWWPSKWTGGAWTCPSKHQIPQEKFDWGFYGGNKYATFCPGCNRWVERHLMTWDNIEKKCTMGYARRKSIIEEDEDKRSIDIVQASDKISTCGEAGEH